MTPRASFVALQEQMARIFEDVQRGGSMKERAGWIEVIVGSMFSGKTEELIRLLRRAELARKPLQVFKPRLDQRYSDSDVASHASSRMPSIVIEHPHEIWQHLLPDTQVVGIDEGQFFGDELVTVCNRLADRGIRVIVAGLDTDWKGEPFAPMPALMATAEIVKKQHAICVVCGNLASRTQRIVKQTDEILVGSAELYEARCRSCFDPHLAHVRQTAGQPHYTSMGIEHGL
jgi:thymidine kinase